MEIKGRALTLKIGLLAEPCLHALPPTLAVLLGAALAGRYGARAEAAAVLFFMLTILFRAILFHARPLLPLGCVIEGAWGCAALAAGYLASGRFPPCSFEIPYFLLAFSVFSFAKVVFNKDVDEQDPGPLILPLAGALFLLVLLAPVPWLWLRHAPWYVCAALTALAASIVALAFISPGKRRLISSALILWSIYLGALTLLVRLY